MGRGRTERDRRAGHGVRGVLADRPAPAPPVHVPFKRTRAGVHDIDQIGVVLRLYRGHADRVGRRAGVKQHRAAGHRRRPHAGPRAANRDVRVVGRQSAQMGIGAGVGKEVVVRRRKSRDAHQRELVDHCQVLAVGHQIGVVLASGDAGANEGDRRIRHAGAGVGDGGAEDRREARVQVGRVGRAVDRRVGLQRVDRQPPRRRVDLRQRRRAERQAEGERQRAPDDAPDHWSNL